MKVKNRGKYSLSCKKKMKNERELKRKSSVRYYVN